LFVRNDAFDSSNIEGDNPAKLKRYNAGFTVGGPVTRDRAWYFGSFEHAAETRGSLFPPDIPDVLREGEDFSHLPETSSDRMFGKYTRHVRTRNDLRTEASWSRLKRVHELAGPDSLPSASNDNLTNTFLGAIAFTAAPARASCSRVRSPIAVRGSARIRTSARAAVSASSSRMTAVRSALVRRWRTRNC